jgi:3-dehydroquinate dehydratase-1
MKLKKPPFVCAVITDSIDGKALKRAEEQGADLVELRLDTFKDRKGIKEKLEKIELPVLLTIRSKREGGKIKIGDAERLALFKELTPYVDFIDIELSSRGILAEVLRTAKKWKKTAIVSYHNFRATPAGLGRIVKTARRSGADMVKIATLARSVEDIKRLLGILLAEKNMIVVAMGRAGRSARVFFPLLGSVVTYGAVAEKTAPGQFALRELKNILSLLQGQTPSPG